MKYALVLEKDSESCNHTSFVLSSMGYRVTPVFSQRKALLAACMIHFDLIVTYTAVSPDDRRCLIAELRRCSPKAVTVFLAEPQSDPGEKLDLDQVNNLLYRPITPQLLHRTIEYGLDGSSIQSVTVSPPRERRKLPFS